MPATSARAVLLLVTVTVTFGLLNACVPVSIQTQTRAGVAAPATGGGEARQAVPPDSEKNGRAWGPIDAPFQVLKFIDFQCPTCAQYAGAYEPGIVNAFAGTGKVRFEIRILTYIGPESYNAGLASLCAADQNAFWPMYHLIFESQPFGRENTGTFSKAYLTELAGHIGLDTKVFSHCLDSEAHQATLDQDSAEAKRYGLGRVPAMVINGKLYDTVRTADDLKTIFAQIVPPVTPTLP